MTALRTPAQAVAFALTQSRWDHAMCLNFVWRCYAPDDSISSALSAQGYPPPINRAIDGWNASPMKHADRSPAIGAPVYYTAASGGATAGDGHVAIYVGGGMIRSSDAGGYGINATVPLDWPERNWGRRLLGWTGDILGHPLDLTTTAGGNSSPITPKPKLEIDDMKLILDTSNDTVAAVGAGRYYPFGRPTQTSNSSYKAVAKVWGDLTDATRLTHDEFVENVHAACGNIDLAKPYPR